jgi:AcrR family transcriptional regulator
MNKIKQSPKLPPKKRREQLLTSARKLFVKNGYRGTTIDEIAKKAKLTKGAVYFHFKSKEDIFLELVKSISDHNSATLKAQLGDSISPSEFFGVLLKLHHKCDVNEYGDLIDIWTQAWRVPRIRRYIIKRMRSTMELFSARVKVPPGWSKEDMHNLAMFVFALVHGLSGLRMLVPRDVDLEAQVKLLDIMFDRKTTTRVRRQNK